MFLDLRVFYFLIAKAVAIMGTSKAIAEPTMIARELPPFMKITPRLIATAATTVADATGSKNGSAILSFITTPARHISGTLPTAQP